MCAHREVDLEERTITVERRAEGGVQVLKTALPCLITMLEDTNEMRFAQHGRHDPRRRATRCASGARKTPASRTSTRSA